MAIRYVTSVLMALGVLLVSRYEVEGSPIMNAFKPGMKERSLKEMDTRRLLGEVERLEAVEKELSRRAEVEELYDELEEMVAEDRKRDVVPIRLTPIPEVKRLKITPPPFVAEPFYRLAATPVPPSDMVRRPELQYPYNLVDQPLRQTPKPLRITPVPYVRPPVYPHETADRVAYVQRDMDQDMEQVQEMWDQIYRRNLLLDRRAQGKKNREKQRRSHLSVGYINKPYARREWMQK